MDVLGVIVLVFICFGLPWLGKKLENKLCDGKECECLRPGHLEDKQV